MVRKALRTFRSHQRVTAFHSVRNNHICTTAYYAVLYDRHDTTHCYQHRVPFRFTITYSIYSNGWTITEGQPSEQRVCTVSNNGLAKRGGLACKGSDMYPDCSFPHFYTVTPRECCDSTLKKATAASFHIIYNVGTTH